MDGVTQGGPPTAALVTPLDNSLLNFTRVPNFTKFE